jgi:hypothetical protein
VICKILNACGGEFMSVHFFFELALRLLERRDVAENPDVVNDGSGATVGVV